MKPRIIDKQEILNNCRELIMEYGLDNINMRNVARKCDIALGSLYNYFPNKNALLIAVIKDVWQHIFHMDMHMHFDTYFDCLLWLDSTISKGEEQYPGFINIHTLIIGANADDTADATKEMHMWLHHMEHALLSVLERDENIVSSRFNDTFTKQRFVRYCIQQLVNLHINKNSDREQFLNIINVYCYK